MDALELAVQNDLELLTLPPKYWDFKCVPLCPVYVVLGVELRVSSVLVEHFTCLATSQHILILANQKHLLILKSQVLFLKLYSGGFVLFVHP